MPIKTNQNHCIDRIYAQYPSISIDQHNTILIGIDRHYSPYSIDRENPVMKMFRTAILQKLESVIFVSKNLRRLWLAYTELQGNFYMLQLISVDNCKFAP